MCNVSLRRPMKKIVAVVISAALLWPGGWRLPEAAAAVSPQIAEFLCERGMSFYMMGKYPEALQEFKKALLANPDSAVAREYIRVIASQGPGAALEERKAAPSYYVTRLSAGEPAFLLQTPSQKLAPSYKSAVYDLNSAVVADKKKAKASSKPLSVSEAAGPVFKVVSEELVFDIHALGSSIDPNNIAVSIGDKVILKGVEISRSLVTDPGLMKILQTDRNQATVEPLELGSTFVHIWDSQGRTTLKFRIGPRRFEQAIFEAAQERLREANLPESFKFSYGIESENVYTGRGFGDQQRTGLTYTYNSSLLGETPVGNFDSAVQGSRSQLGTYQVSNLRMGITNGHYDQFKDFTLRWFDFTPTFTSFGFPATDLRGVMLDSPAFHKTLNYNTFWGALPNVGFSIGSTQSGLNRTKQAWLEGGGVSYQPVRWANFKSFYVHSYGPDLAQPVLTQEAEGFGMNYILGHLNLDTSMVYDGLKSISYTASSTYTWPKLRAGLTVTDNNKNFASLYGGEPASGSSSGTFNLTYRPTDTVTISNDFGATIDRVFGNPDLPGRPNYHDNTHIYWAADRHTEWELGYILDDLIGSNSPSVTETKEVTLRKKFYFLRKLNSFVTFQNRKSKYYTSPAQDFNNNRLLGGLNCRLIGDLYGYYNREFNYLRNTFTGETAFPMAQEVGLYYNRQIDRTPWYLNLRLSYHDEEQTESQLSFLTGEDRLEGEAEFTYKPNPNTEGYVKTRVTNVWAEKESAGKHLDIDLSWGLRFVWDTGLRWQTVGAFDGYVFYDLNADGNRQSNEKGVAGAVIKGPEGRSAATDEKGYYKITGIAGKQAALDLDLKSLPKGYNPTGPTHREADIVFGKVKRLDFGIATRTEISGLVFNDKNGNGVFDAGDEPVKGVVIILDDKQRAVTTLTGEYLLRRLNPGEHTLKLDLKSIPVKFIPKIPISKSLKVIEGAAFIYNVPLEEVKKK